MIGSKLNVSHQGALAAQMASSVLGYVTSTASRLKGVITPLYLALIRLHTEYCIQLGIPQYKKDIDKLEHLQQRPPKW